MEIFQIIGNPTTATPWQPSTSLSPLEDIRRGVNDRGYHSYMNNKQVENHKFIFFNSQTSYITYPPCWVLQKINKPSLQRWACLSATIPFCLWALLLYSFFPLYCEFTAFWTRLLLCGKKGFIFILQKEIYTIEMCIYTYPTLVAVS